MPPKLLISLGLFSKEDSANSGIMRRQWFGFRLLISAAVLVLCGAASCGGQSTPKNNKKSSNRTELAKDFLKRNDLSSARLEAEKAIAHNPKNPEAHSILGLVDFLQGVNNFRLLEVEDCLTGIDAEGLGLEMNEFFQAAQDSFHRATTIDPEYSEAYSNEASAAAQLEDYAGAIELNNKALLIPHRLINLGLTRANLGWAKFKSGDVVGAAKDLRQSLQFNPEMCIAKYRLGRVYFEREEWNKALQQFRAVVETESCPLQEANLYFIRTMRQLSMTDEAQNAVEQCTALAPQSCVAAQCKAGL